MKSVLYRIVLAAALTLSFIVVVSWSFDSRQGMENGLSPPIITKGHTRVTLLHIAQTTSYIHTSKITWSSSKYSGNAIGNDMVAVPGVQLVYLIEYVGDDEIDRGHIKKSGYAEIWTGGRQLQDIECVSSERGPYSSNEIYGISPPSVIEDSKAWCQSETLIGAVIQSQTVDVKIRVGANQEAELFEFRSIPVY